MPEKSSATQVRIIGSRELHQKLPEIMRELEDNDARFVLTVHGKPKAVLVGASTYLDLIQGSASPCEALVGLQLSAMLGTSLDDQSLDLIKNRMIGEPDRRRSEIGEQGYQKDEPRRGDS